VNDCASIGSMLFDFFIACLSHRKHDEGTGEWPVDWHKLTRRLSHRLVVF